jgi:hypothetical protein
METWAQPETLAQMVLRVQKEMLVILATQETLVPTAKPVLREPLGLAETLATPTQLE